MRVARLDPCAGLTGAMWLGALLDAGASLEAVHDAVGALGVGNVRITMGRVRRGPLTAVSVRVRAPEHAPPVRTLERVQQLIAYAAVDEAVRDRSITVLDRLAQARDASSPDTASNVEIHPFTALDTATMVVAVAAALTSLRVERVGTGPVVLGSGQVETVHGRRPATDPVVDRLLERFETRPCEVPGLELVDPTGAALLAGLAVRDDARPAAVDARGRGAGAPDLPSPGVLEVTIGTR